MFGGKTGTKVMIAVNNTAQSSPPAFPGCFPVVGFVLDQRCAIHRGEAMVSDLFSPV